MKGRPPKSTEQHLRAGTFRADRHGSLPVAVGGRPAVAEFAEPPASLTAPGREWWAETVVPAVEAGVLDRADMSIALLAAQQWDRIVKCERVISVDGFFATGSTGQIKEHPAVKMQREATALYLRLGEQLGLGAVSRARLGLAHLSAAARWRDFDRVLQGDGDADAVVVASGALEVGLPGV